MFLSDRQLVELLKDGNPIVRGAKAPADWYDRNSPIQPASIDLSVGKIHIPGTARDDSGGEQNPKTEHTLEPGETAVVATQEQFNLPSDMLGIGFPPSRVSFKGILMTNPGHIDPGYQGPMRFTIINMGSEKFILRVGDPIVSVLLFKLAAGVHKDWLRRHGGTPGDYPKQDDINKLSADFVNVTSRAKEIARQEVGKAELKLKSWQASVPLIVGVLAFLTTIVTTWIIPGWKEPVANIQTDVQVLKASMDMTSLKSRLDALEREFNASRNSVNPQTSPAPTR